MLTGEFPPIPRRLAPDFFFHDQIYRADGETVALAPGKYTVQIARGPEYRVQTRTLVVPADSVQPHSSK